MADSDLMTTATPPIAGASSYHHGGSLLRLTMPTRLRWWAILGACARLTHRFSRLSLWTFSASARRGGSLAVRLSGPAAVTAARKAIRTVPAYASLVSEHGRPLPARTAEAWLGQLPVATKRSYIDGWSLAQRCRGGHIPARGCDLDESAGSTGAPYTWIRSQRELEDVHRSLALLSRHLLPADDRPLIVLNAFSMGAWATGTNVAAALRAIAVVKSCGPDIDKVLGTVRLLGAEPTYVVCGYPPFLRNLIDAAAERGQDLSAMTMYAFVGGEGMTEAARRRLERTFTRVWSAYGASDLDIGVAAETPVSVWLRQQAAERPELARALFGRTDRLPMVFQYDPCDYHVEVVASPSGANELVVTVTRPMLSPRIRYNVGDEGGTIDFPIAMAACRHLGLDPGEAEIQPFRLPFLFVHGRSDHTVSFMGANLYPEDVAAGIDAHPSGDRLGAFCMELAEVDEDDVRPYIHIEAPEALRNGATADELITVIRNHLAVASADYREALVESATAADLRVRLWETGAGPFALNAGRIKHRQVLMAPAAA
jgi:phenylacetate-CoA ligase